MLKIGITGGIGSGKSIVCRILESLGYPIFYSDLKASLITANHPEVRSELIDRYGNQTYMDGKLNREFLAKRIFQNDDEREFVNNLIHPKVRKAFDDFAAESNSPFVFNEAAILFETGSYKHFDKTILVTAPKSLRLKRVIARDNCSAESVQHRMDSQWNDEQKIPLADLVIVNDGETALLRQIEMFLSELQQASKH